MSVIRVLQVGLTSNWGGTETFVMSIYRHIDRTKIQFDFLVDHNKVLPFEDEIAELGGRVFHEYYYVREKNEIDYISPDDFFVRHQDIDAIALNVQEINTLARLLKAAKKAGIPCRIMHSHNSNYMHQQSFKQRIYEIYGRQFLLPYATRNLACSNSAGKFLFHKDRGYEVIPNSIDARKFKFCEEKRILLRQELGLKKEDIVLGFVGSFNEQKNIFFLIDVLSDCVKQNDNYKLLMLGDGILFSKAQDYIEKKALCSHVLCLGCRENASDFYSAMDCFILPSKFEGFGIVLLEAQANGLVCFTSKGVVPYETNVTGQVNFIPLNDRSLFWANEIIENSKDRYDGYTNLISSKYNITELVKRMESIYLGEKND